MTYKEEKRQHYIANKTDNSKEGLSAPFCHIKRFFSLPLPPSTWANNDDFLQLQPIIYISFLCTMTRLRPQSLLFFGFFSKAISTLLQF